MVTRPGATQSPILSPPGRRTSPNIAARTRRSTTCEHVHPDRTQPDEVVEQLDDVATADLAHEARAPIRRDVQLEQSLRQLPAPVPVLEMSGIAPCWENQKLAEALDVAPQEEKACLIN